MMAKCETAALPNAFIDKPQKPSDDELSAALGPAKILWDQLISGLADEDDADAQEWKSYSRRAGWSLRLMRRKRTIVWLSPCRDCFRVAFILGDKAVKAARHSGLPQRIVKLIDKAPRYPEGTGVRLEVRRSEDLACVKKLAKVKLEN
jgi:hypothetical protein